MPIIATILVSPHPLQPGWWDGHHWSERQTARCSNDFLRGTDSGPPQPNATGFRHLGVSAGFRGLVTAGSFWLPAWRVPGPALFHSWSGGVVGHGDDGGGDAGDGVLRGGVAEAAG
jgi:hypothetical protein